MHVVTYRCELCRAGHTRAIGERTDGLCPSCGAPMRIEDVFGDRRILSVPVTEDRRDDGHPQAA